MKNIEKLNIKLLLIPNATAFFGLLFATEAQNLFTVAYCVVIFLFITLLHLIECYRLNGNTRTVIRAVNLIFFLLALFNHNWLLVSLTLIILTYIELKNAYIYKSNN